MVFLAINGISVAYHGKSKNKFVCLFFILQPAFSYDIVVQTTGDTWHIPYKDVYEEKYSYQVPRKWLCLHRKYRRV